MQNQLRNHSVIKAFLSETPFYRDSIKKVVITDQFSVGKKHFQNLLYRSLVGALFKLHFLVSRVIFDHYC